MSTLVKEPEAELIIVMKASYLHNTSQAKEHWVLPGPWRRGVQLPHCRPAASLETRSRGLERAQASVTWEHLQCGEAGRTAGQDEHQPGLRGV